MYTVDRVYSNYYEGMHGRMQFSNPDPKSGDASLEILNLKSTDTGTYQCKVKKAPGVQSQKIQLTVLGKIYFSSSLSSLPTPSSNPAPLPPQ